MSAFYIFVKIFLHVGIVNHIYRSYNLFNALLVTDITQLSSIMFLASDPAFEQVIQLPVQDEHIYYMKNIVSRKKQLIPLLTEMLENVEQ